MDQKNKQQNRPTHQLANEYSIFSSGNHEVCAYKGKRIYHVNCLHMVAFPVTADSLFWRPACRKLWRATPEPAAAQHQEHVLRGRSHLSSPTPLSWARVLKHRPDVLFPSLYLMRLSSTPIKCHIFLLFIKSYEFFIAICSGKSKLTMWYFHFSTPYLMYWKFPTDHQIS